MPTQPKFNEEKILYFASQAGGFHINKDRHRRTSLWKLIQDAVNNGYLEVKRKDDADRYYGTTPKGLARLAEHKANYAARTGQRDGSARYTEEKILHFASQPRHLHVDTQKERGTTLSAIVEQAEREGYIQAIKRDGHNVYYTTTPRGTARLSSLKQDVAAPSSSLREVQPRHPINVDSSHMVTHDGLDINTAALNLVLHRISDEGIWQVDMPYQDTVTALLKTGWFEAQANDDAYTYFDVAPSARDALASYLQHQDVNRLMAELPILQNEQNVHLSKMPETLSEYRAMGMKLLQDMVVRNELSQDVLDGLNDLHWDELFLQGALVSHAVEAAVATQDALAKRSPRQLQQESQQVQRLAARFLEDPQNQTQLPYERAQAFCDYVGEQLSRKLSLGEAEHTLRYVLSGEFAPTPDTTSSAPHRPRR